MSDAAGIYQEKMKKSPFFQLREEFTDVLNCLLDLTNCFHVDLEQAFREKNKLNEQCKWD